MVAHLSWNCRTNHIFNTTCSCFVFAGQNTYAEITSEVLFFKRAEKNWLLLHVFLFSNEDWSLWYWCRCVPVSAVCPPQPLDQMYSQWACRGAEARLQSTLSSLIHSDTADGPVWWKQLKYKLPLVSLHKSQTWHYILWKPSHMNNFFIVFRNKLYCSRRDLTFPPGRHEQTVVRQAPYRCSWVQTCRVEKNQTEHSRWPFAWFTFAPLQRT